MLHATQNKFTAKARPKHCRKESKTMAKNSTKNQQAIFANDEKSVLELTAAEQAAEQAAIALHKANMADLIDAMLFKAGMATSEDEHKAARPQTAQEKAEAALQAIGLDLASLTPAKAEIGKLAVDVKGIASCLGKYGKHCFAPDTANGTSLVTYSITKQLVETGKATLAKTLDDARQHLPTYSSTGHFNTCKRMLKEHYTLNIWQGGFSINAK